MTASSDSDRYLASAPKLKLVCAKCGSSGLIPVAQLDRVLFCGVCRLWYRVGRSGLQIVAPPKEERIRVAVRTISSQWREHQAVIRERPRLRVRVAQAALRFGSAGSARWIAVAVLLFGVTAGIVVGARQPEAPDWTPFPTALPERAQLWTTALAQRDMAVLTGLTDPALHRALRIWLAHGPDVPASMLAGAACHSEIVSVQQDVKLPGQATVVARLVPAAGKPWEIIQHWNASGTTWYFQPPKLRMARSPSR